MDYRFLGVLFITIGGYLTGATIFFDSFLIFILVAIFIMMPLEVLGLICIDKFYKEKEVNNGKSKKRNK